MGNFLLLAFLLQSGVEYIRELFPKLDGKYVVPFAVGVGIVIAWLVPEVRIGLHYFGPSTLPWADAIFTGACMALGAKLVHKALKSIESYRPAPPEKPT